jgi:hypothetical protein
MEKLSHRELTELRRALIKTLVHTHAQFNRNIKRFRSEFRKLGEGQSTTGFVYNLSGESSRFCNKMNRLNRSIQLINVQLGRNPLDYPLINVRPISRCGKGFMI